MVPDDRSNHVHANLGSLFRKPFVTVDILGRAYCHGEPVRMGAEVAFAPRDPCPGPSRVGIFKDGAEEGPAAVYNRNLIAIPVSQHLHAMC